MAGVTKRTLRYYDRIGLLEPRKVSESGHRLYADGDLVRLEQIMTLKFIGFSLAQIRSIVDMSDMNLAVVLSMQREWMEDNIKRMQLALQAIKEAERIIEYGQEETAEQLKRIIEVVEMATNRDWSSEFLLAAINYNEEKAKTILAANHEIPTLSIYVAAALGEAKIVQEMLEKDASLAVKPGGPENWEPLLYLCFSCFLKKREYEERFVQTAKLLIEYGADVNSSYTQKDDPHERQLSCLYGVAGIAGNAAVAEILLAEGANPNDGESLYHAAELPEYECLEVLYRYGADLNATPALFRKLDFDDYFGVKWFLEHGADPNLTLGDQGTTLHWAVYRDRSVATIELLLKHGAQVNLKTPDGKTAYTLATRFGRTDIIDILCRHGAVTDVENVDRLFGAYAVVDEPTVHGMIKNEPTLISSLSYNDQLMLLEFAELNKAETVSLMLNTGFDHTVQKGVGTALHIAAWFGHIETVQVLINHGASLTLQNVYGGTPLGSAIHGSIHCNPSREGSHAAVVEALILAGAEVPAKAVGNKEVFEILQKYGAE
ncbi:ankyrin repeat protein/DNA-binding transcriptional MerR regulator [Lederbergia wuyishanensis]|uniref:Ankyrin repeat protein/DNA-binding transcriptional MerR regulator n=2 Tax=Lederbergia wuyishanensis TaxID=1347903 RepID=A0ABU0D8G2_9BACI|nr:ankyrin repeat domain-containing protein [Lederbergia wuyishanensis]MDQ0344701.1 ankyrin repeat protein/DNA-binding transcriptional MerR regulator [Lederbergia wuyishanensis]